MQSFWVCRANQLGTSEGLIVLADLLTKVGVTKQPEAALYRMPLFMTAIDYKSFITLLKCEYPDVHAEIDDIAEGLLHLEKSVLAHSTERAIAAANWAVVASHLKFIETLLIRANEELRNAVAVSYFENVFLGLPSERMREAREMLPPTLAMELIELESHFEKLAKTNLISAI